MKWKILLLIGAALLTSALAAAEPRTLPDGITVYPSQSGLGVAVAQSTEPGGWLCQGPLPAASAFWTPIISQDKRQAIVQAKPGDYNVLFFPAKDPSQPKAFPIRIGGTNPQPVPPVPPDPVPPVPPEPTTGLNVALIAPRPTIIRALTPEQAAIPSSRTLRDWCEKHCEKDDDGKTPAFKILLQSNDLGLLSPRWKTLLERAPKDKPVLAAISKSGKFYLDVLPANLAETRKVLADVSGIPFSDAKPLMFPKLQEVSDADWAKYNPPDKEPIVGGQRRFLSLVPRDLKANPIGSLGFAKPLAAYGINIIPREEWPARIRALKDASAGLMALTYPIPPYDQGSTNYCWANCVCQGFVAMAYQQGRPLYRISAASIGAPIVNYRNAGGMPSKAVEYFIAHGGVDEALWPTNDISPKYDRDPNVKADRPKNKITANLADLGASGKIFDETATCVLLGAPVAVAYNWWSHAVLAVGLEQKDGKWYLILRNSWGDFEDNGFFLLPEGSGRNKGTPDDAQAILSVLAA